MFDAVQTQHMSPSEFLPKKISLLTTCQKECPPTLYFHLQVSPLLPFQTHLSLFLPFFGGEGHWPSLSTCFFSFLCTALLKSISRHEDALEEQIFALNPKGKAIEDFDSLEIVSLIRFIKVLPARIRKALSHTLRRNFLDGISSEKDSSLVQSGSMAVVRKVFLASRKRCIKMERLQSISNSSAFICMRAW